ncbi:MAG: glycosyltransferase, partial [Flavobacteriaceae bacterium]
SKRTSKWEELFGLVIIESMSQGVIPVSSSHSGPKEIITEGTGYLFEEGQMERTLINILEKKDSPNLKAAECIKISKHFLPKHIAERWKAILIS